MAFTLGAVSRGIEAGSPAEIVAAFKARSRFDQEPHSPAPGGTLNVLQVLADVLLPDPGKLGQTPGRVKPFEKKPEDRVAQGFVPFPGP